MVWKASGRNNPIVPAIADKFILPSFWSAPIKLHQSLAYFPCQQLIYSFVPYFIILLRIFLNCLILKSLISLKPTISHFSTFSSLRICSLRLHFLHGRLLSHLKNMANAAEYLDTKKTSSEPFLSSQFNSYFSFGISFDILSLVASFSRISYFSQKKERIRIPEMNKE